MHTDPLTCRVLVVGAGPAGSTAAGLLARQGWDVLLADRSAFPRDKTCGDGLTPRALAVLERVGVLADLEAGGQHGGARLTAPSGATWRLRFGDCGLGLPPYGLVVPRPELDDRLRGHAVAQGAHFCACTSGRRGARRGASSA